MDITAAAAATTAAATWLAYLELLETTVGDICAKFEANPLSSRAASSGEAGTLQSAGFKTSQQAFRAKNRRNQFLCAKSEIFRARSARVREIIFCAKSENLTARVRAARVRAARVRAPVSLW